MLKQRGYGTAVHTVALPVAVNIANEVANRDFIDGVGAIEVIGVVGFFPESQERTSATGNPVIPGTANTEDSGYTSRCSCSCSCRYSRCNKSQTRLCMETAPFGAGAGGVGAALPRSSF
jgi:hypothetical protein